ncbi:MAG TPA: hypothetical protein VHF50_01905 [Solirubrobacterales bacterium]|nr:hypothetical protein [Solirubrobacterales bacterium]
MRRTAILAIAVALPMVSTASSPAAAAPTDAPLLIRQLAISGPEYVMLQMTADGQSELAGETLDFYGIDGTIARSVPLSGTLANAESQRAILIATEAAAAAPGFPQPDVEIADQDALDPDGGAVCIHGVYPADCVAWSHFPSINTPAGGSLPDPQSNAGVDPFGNVTPVGALGRSIDQPCPTWLDRLDDTGSSGKDFAGGVQPRNNSASPPEVACTPETIFNATPGNPTNDTTPTFAFGESPPDFGPRFECSFQGAPFTACPPAGNTYGPLADGLYEFRAKASVGGEVDPTPASWTFEVDTVPPETTITSTPGAVSSGFAASFSFSSSEHHPTFVCRLDNGPKQPCEPGKTYFFLAEGRHTFRVWSSDQATNQDPSAAEHVFLVDTSFGDSSPPFTDIGSGPPSRTRLTSARFAYSSNEPGSRFECRIDSEAFSACEATGKAYPALRNGRHVFEVRAIDRAGNPDPTPAAHVWTVEGTPPETTIDKAPPGVIRTGKRRIGLRFSFSSSRPRSEFACRLDKRRFRPCGSPMRIRAGRGRHRFEVFATDALGNVDPSPARRLFRVIAKGRGSGVFGGPARGKR